MLSLGLLESPASEPSAYFQQHPLLETWKISKGISFNPIDSTTPCVNAKPLQLQKPRFQILSESREHWWIHSTPLKTNGWNFPKAIFKVQPFVLGGCKLKGNRCIYIYITRHRLRFLNSSVWDVWGNWEPSGFCPNIGKPLKSMEIGRGWPVRKDTPGKNLLPPQCSRLEIPHLVSCLYIIHLVDFPGWFCCLCWRVPSSHATHSIHMWQPVLQTCIMAHIYVCIYMIYCCMSSWDTKQEVSYLSTRHLHHLHMCK